MNMKDIFLVDADDTLLDFHGVSAKALRAAFLASNLPWKEEYLSVFREVNDAFWRALERKELTREALMERRFPAYLARLGFAGVDGAAFNRLFIEYLATHPAYNVGAEAFLQELNEMGRVYIVTNGTGWIQKSRFTLVGLYAYATDVFVSDKIGYEKPAKEFTDYAVAHIPDFLIERAVWIGDSLSADISAAKHAGICSIWYNPERKKATGKARPDFEAENFAQILKILRSNV